MARGTRFPQVASLALSLGPWRARVGAGRRGELTSWGIEDASYGLAARHEALSTHHSFSVEENLVLEISLFGLVRMEQDIRVKSNA